MEDAAAPLDNTSTSPTAAAASIPPTEEEAAVVQRNDESGDNNGPPSPSPPSPHHHRRSKREKYSPNRFVAQPSIRHGKGPADEQDAVAAADDGVEAVSEKEAKASSGAKDVDTSNNNKPRRRTSRAHAAPPSYEEPPDVEDEEFTDDDDDGVKMSDAVDDGEEGNEESEIIMSMNEEEDEDQVQQSEHVKPPAAATTTTLIDDSKPRLNSTVRVITGDFVNLTGKITNIKVAGWCTIDNPEILKPVRMCHLEVLSHSGPPPSPVKRETTTPKKKRGGRGRRRGSGRRSGIGSSSGNRNNHHGRPVRDRKPPQSLLASPQAKTSSPSRPRRSTRGGSGDNSPTPSKRGDLSVRRSKRGPTPSPRFQNHHHPYDDNEEEQVRPRGKRGRSSSASSKQKEAQQCKAPSCIKYRQASCEGYCTLCYKLFQRGEFDDDPAPTPRSTNRECRIGSCTKYNQYNCEGYCAAHYRKFVLEGGDEEEEEEEVVSPPKKRARRVKHEIEEEEEEEEEELGEGEESPFDDPPRMAHHRHYCKVKKCTKFSQGRPKGGMCFKHFKQYGLWDGKKKKKSRGGGGDDVVDITTGEIEVGSLVMVKERTGTGMNKPGGVGRVTKVYNHDTKGTMYDVKYVLGGREKGVNSKFLWLHDLNAKSPMKPPPSFEEEEEDDDAMLNEDDESIEDDELEGFEDFSFSQLDVPDQSVLEQRSRRRTEQLNALSGNNLEVDDDDHNHRLEENWECAKCGGLNRPNATTRCTTCQSYRVEKNASEDALLERTRYELLNGNDFWICPSCVIGVPSLLMPCGRCQSHISFVPLTMPEFEDFVRKQRQINREREKEIQLEWDQTLEEIVEEWGEGKEKESAQKQQEVWTKLPCKTLGCREICAPNCEGFCEDHFRTVIVLEEPEAFPLVVSEDKPLIADYFYLTYEQFRPCALQDWERTKKHNDVKVARGHPGIACRHCFGRENPTLRSMGRYFPTTENSLYQQTFTTNAIRHLLECPHCPSKVKSRLVSMKEELDNPPSDTKKGSAKFVGEKGGRGKFFKRVWCRLHRLPLDEELSQTPKKKKKSSKGD